MSQNIRDRTHQHAHSSRSRRASVVKEVAQSEHENISTRVIATITICTRDRAVLRVVQIYRVEVDLAKVERIVFIPVALADFDDENLIRRFQRALAAAALTLEMRAALRNLDVVQLSPELKTRFAGFGKPLDLAIKEAVFAKPEKIIASAVTPVQPVEIKADLELKELMRTEVRSAITEALAEAPIQEAPAAQFLQLNPALPVNHSSTRCCGRPTRLETVQFARPSVVAAESTAIQLPNDVSWWRGGGGRRAFADRDHARTRRSEAEREPIGAGSH